MFVICLFFRLVFLLVPRKKLNQLARTFLRGKKLLVGGSTTRDRSILCDDDEWTNPHTEKSLQVFLYIKILKM